MGWTIIQPTHHMCLTNYTHQEKFFRLKIQKFISNNHVWERPHHRVAYAKFFLGLKRTSGHDQLSVTLLDKYFQMETVQVCLGLFLLKYRIFDQFEILNFSKICSIRTKSKATGPLIKKGFGSLGHKL